MSSKVSSSGELLSRWRRIEEDEEENDDSDPSTVRRLNQRKEQWFPSYISRLLALIVYSLNRVKSEIRQIFSHYIAWISVHADFFSTFFLGLQMHSLY